MRDGYDHRGGHVSGEEHDYEVAPGRPQHLRRPSRTRCVGYETGIDDDSVEFPKTVGHGSGGPLELGQKVGELWPISAETTGDEPYHWPRHGAERHHRGRHRSGRGLLWPRFVVPGNVMIGD